MKEHYVSYDCAVKLKELGFDWKCDHYYTFQKILTESRVFPATFKISDFWHNFNEADQQNRHNQPFYPECSAPRLDQAAAWLREAKGWDVTSIPTLAKYGKKKYRWAICHWDNPEYGNCSNGIFDTYESALSAGIDAALELLTNKQSDK